MVEWKEGRETRKGYTEGYKKFEAEVKGVGTLTIEPSVDGDGSVFLIRSEVVGMLDSEEAAKAVAEKFVESELALNRPPLTAAQKCERGFLPTEACAGDCGGYDHTNCPALAG
jgi:hypothetical protein